MSGDLMAGRQIKHGQTKKFLEEACALIELGNLVESYKLGHTKLHKRRVCDSKVDECKCKIQRKAIEANPGSTQNDGVAKLKSEARRQTRRRHKPTLNDSVAHSKSNSVDSKTCTSNLKRDSKYKLEKVQSKKDNEKNDTNGERDNNTQKRHRSTTSRKSGRKITDRKIRRQVLASNFDMANFIQLYPLKDRLKYDNLRKTPIILLPKTKTWSSFSSLSDALLINQNSVNRKTCKPGETIADNETESRKSDVKTSSLHLSLNLRVKPNSNTVNLLIKSRKGNCKTDISDLDALSLRLPLQRTSSTSQNLVDKLSAKLCTSCADRSAPSPSAQTSNDQKLQILKQTFPAAPYAKTQAVYNMYDVALTQEPCGVRGLKSHLYFNLNIGRGPKSAPRWQNSSGTSTINSQPSIKRRSEVRYKSKVNMNSGLTSMQQSFTLDRRSRQSENELESESDDVPQVCRCRPVCEPVACSDIHQSGSVCEPCGQPEHKPRGKEQTPLPEDLLERYALLYHRTKQRICDRVGLTTEDARSMVFSPRVFMKKLYERYKNISNKIEAQQRSVGSCTCSPFIETEQVSVQEGNINPECSLLKRCFGQLLFNNKCVVCSRNKRIGPDYRPLKPYECEPGECVEKKSLFGCFKKLCKRKEVDEKTKKAKEKDKKKKKKELDRKKRIKEKLKGKGGTGFLTSIFKKPDVDDDRQRLLNDEGKKKKRSDDPGKGKEGKTTELQDKAKKTFAFGRRGYRRATRRIRERYYRNKKLAEEQKGRYACDFYLMSLRNKPCLWVYYLCPFFYPYCLQLLNVWRQVSDLLLFFVAIVVWSPCILFAEMLKVLACNMCVA